MNTTEAGVCTAGTSLSDQLSPFLEDACETGLLCRHIKRERETHAVWHRGGYTSSESTSSICKAYTENQESTWRSRGRGMHPHLGCHCRRLHTTGIHVPVQTRRLRVRVRTECMYTCMYVVACVALLCPGESAASREESEGVGEGGGGVQPHYT